jgi:hypothetical protein
MNLEVGDKVRFFMGQKIRLVTEVSECGEWFKWGENTFWCSVKNYVKMPPESVIDHSSG